LYRASIRFMRSAAIPSCVALRCIFSSFRGLFFSVLFGAFLLLVLWLFFCSFVLLFFCSFVLLFFCSFVLLFFCFGCFVRAFCVFRMFCSF
jgi:hypothetical protein